MEASLKTRRLEAVDFSQIINTVIAGVLTVGVGAAMGGFMKIGELEQSSATIVDKLDELQIEILRDIDKLEARVSRLENQYLEREQYELNLERELEAKRALEKEREMQERNSKYQSSQFLREAIRN